ncbi:MAG TPA: M28 family peptidase [Vicinamibacterales bacterium]|nr:M28 family peptidase [Vicinamibacterales bacterium]
MQTIHIAWTAGFAVVIAALASLPTLTQPSAERRLGFTAAAFARQLEHEARYSAALTATAISNAHRALTERPHRAGTDGARVVAEYLRDELSRAGLDVEMPEYLAYLSAPRSIQIDLVAPARERLSVVEAPDARDPDTAHPALDPGFIAYSTSGDVTAPVVYVNYGLPADYVKLKAAGVNVAGHIVLARYTRSHRAVKVHTAEREGAAAVILYSDPADDGPARGETWPDGMWRPGHLLQRGNAKYSWFWHGDPLTPGVAATADAEALAPDSAPTLPRIPVVVLSAQQAERILRHLAGASAPEGFRGALPVSYGVGPGPARVHLQVSMEAGRMPIRNVVARLRGNVEPDRWIVLGTHHDAWTFGGIDPGSSAAVIVEVARRLAALKQQGWQPARSILFAFWDAEEYGLIGSTEYAEDRARELQERAVVYINSDMYTPGRFVAGGVPSLRDFVIDVARDLPAPVAVDASAASRAATAETLYDNWRVTERRRQGSSADAEVELSALGSGADFVAFQDYLGIPTLALEYLFEGGYGFGAYHSSYDNRYYMERVSDPGFRYGVELARVLGVTVMRLAAAPVLPFRPSHYADRIGAFLRDAESWRFEGRSEPGVRVNTQDLQALAGGVAERARQVERAIDAALGGGRVPANAQAINDGLARLEQALVDASEPANRRWYRHVVYGWNIYSMYDGQPLPDLADAIRVNDAAAIEREQARIRRALERMRDGVEALARLAGAAAPAR